MSRGTVRFEPLPPATPQEWRRRVEASHAHAQLPQQVFNIATFAANLPPADTEYPMSRRAWHTLREDFALAGLGTLTLEALCRAVVVLHLRHLAAPWWRPLTAAQLERYSPGGEG